MNIHDEGALNVFAIKNIPLTLNVMSFFDVLLLLTIERRPCPVLPEFPTFPFTKCWPSFFLCIPFLLRWFCMYLCFHRNESRQPIRIGVLRRVCVCLSVYGAHFCMCAFLFPFDTKHWPYCNQDGQLNFLPGFIYLFPRTWVSALGSSGHFLNTTDSMSLTSSLIAREGEEGLVRTKNGNLNYTRHYRAFQEFFAFQPLLRDWVCWWN